MDPRRLDRGSLWPLAVALVAVLAAGVLTLPRRARAYIEATMPLGAILSQSSNVVLLEVERVDRQQNVIEFRKVKDLKGRHPTTRVQHTIGQKGFHPREWQNVMNWAQAGSLAVLFHNGGQSETCIDMYWYQCYGGGQDWEMTHAEPYLLRSYAGDPGKLAGLVETMLRGDEVVVPCMVDGDKNDLALRRARIQRLRASLSLQDYDAERDFAGWGADEVEILEGMAGFSHLAALPRVDPDAVGVSAADYDGDARLDLCLFGPARTALLHNNGKSFEEVPLPAIAGSRSAAWADHDGDGRLDLLLAVPGGPRLLGGTDRADSFRDDAALLPELPAWNVTAAAWADADTDGWPDIIIANGFHGLRLLRNTRQGKPEAAGGTPGFADAGAIAWKRPAPPPGASLAGLKGDHLITGDLNGDGRSDLLFCAARGVVLLNTPRGYVQAEGTGIEFDAGGVGPALADFDRDGDLDLFIPAGGFGRLLQNDGRGRFHDITARAIGVVVGTMGTATAAAWSDLDADGWLDLVVTSLRAPNRVFFNRGGAAFEDGTHRLGLDGRIFDSQAVCLADFDADGDIDFALANEARDSCLLFSTFATELKGPRLEVVVEAAPAATGSRLRVISLGAEEKLALETEVGGVQGRGSQAPSRARLGLENGKYRLEVRDSAGRPRTQEFTIDGPAATVTVPAAEAGDG